MDHRRLMAGILCLVILAVPQSARAIIAIDVIGTRRSRPSPRGQVTPIPLTRHLLPRPAAPLFPTRSLKISPSTGQVPGRTRSTTAFLGQPRWTTRLST